ncbi:hypothetical protein J4217_03825 [Candidatus Pacearchaeota archaeon]|nr:hypothetical protein [uncultured archaeon]AQS33231.1 hypothetical protein [uncultured archaeon]MBS3091548.1 hypothetical protein [Candidatus Pacearchaeota archaeon]
MRKQLISLIAAGALAAGCATEQDSQRGLGMLIAAAIPGNAAAQIIGGGLISGANSQQQGLATAQYRNQQAQQYQQQVQQFVSGNVKEVTFQLNAKRGDEYGIGINTKLDIANGVGRQFRCDTYFCYEDESPLMGGKEGFRTTEGGVVLPGTIFEVPYQISEVNHFMFMPSSQLVVERPGKQIIRFVVVLEDIATRRTLSVSRPSYFSYR